MDVAVEDSRDPFQASVSHFQAASISATTASIFAGVSERIATFVPVREFSEKLRLLVEQEFGATETLFPQERRLKREFRDLLQRPWGSRMPGAQASVRSGRRTGSTFRRRTRSA